MPRPPKNAESYAEQQKKLLEENERKTEDRISKLPEALKFICQRCRMKIGKSGQMCPHLTVTSNFCSDLNSLRYEYEDNKKLLEAHKKYSEAFRGPRVFTRKDLERLYHSSIAEGKRSVEEFLSYCNLVGIEYIDTND